jgi:hypothetical protein
MSGSVRVFNYVDDAGTSWAVNVNERNAKAFATGGADRFFPFAVTARPRLPRGTTMRYVIAALVSNPLIKRRFWVGRAAAFPELVAQSGAFRTGVGSPPILDWRVTHYAAEVVQYLPMTDTGQDDGSSGLS